MKKCGEAQTYRVPNLKLDCLIVDLHSTRPKLDTNGEIVRRLKPLVSELQQEARLADA